MLDNVSAKFRDQIEVCSRIGDEGIRNAQLETTTKDRERYWRCWKNFSGIVGVDPFLQPEQVGWYPKARSLVSFGGCVRRGLCGQGKQIASDSVASAFSAIGETIAMVCDGKNPLKQVGSDHFIPPIKNMLAGFKHEDPATQKKLPVEIDVVELCCEWGILGCATAKDRRTGDLILIAFYFLLRVGEYTCSRRNSQPERTKRTVNFQLCDVVFFKKDGGGHLQALSARCDPELRLTADGATLQLTNQKNGWKNVCIHQHANDRGLFNPVRTMARVVNKMHSWGAIGETFLSAFKNKKWEDTTCHRDGRVKNVEARSSKEGIS